MNYVRNYMQITKKTLVSDILNEYGDIADVMEVLGVKRVGKWSIRRFITKFITVERAAKIHKIPLESFLDKLQKAISLQIENKKIEEK